MHADTLYLDFPLTIGPEGRTAATPGDDHVRDMIKLVLFTEPGERVNRPDFGCGLKQLVFAPASDALAAAVEKLVHGSLIRWLDGVINVESVAVTISENVLDIDISYARLDTGEHHNERISRQLGS
jgi:uncharacterized protein